MMVPALSCSRPLQSGRALRRTRRFLWAKGAVEELTLALAAELAPKVRVKCHRALLAQTALLSVCSATIPWRGGSHRFTPPAARYSQKYGSTGHLPDCGGVVDHRTSPSGGRGTQHTTAEGLSLAGTGLANSFAHYGKNRSVPEAGAASHIGPDSLREVLPLSGGRRSLVYLSDCGRRVVDIIYSSLRDGPRRVGRERFKTFNRGPEAPGKGPRLWLRLDKQQEPGQAVTATHWQRRVGSPVWIS